MITGRTPIADQTWISVRGPVALRPGVGADRGAGHGPYRTGTGGDGGCAACGRKAAVALTRVGFRAGRGRRCVKEGHPGFRGVSGGAGRSPVQAQRSLSWRRGGRDAFQGSESVHHTSVSAARARAFPGYELAAQPVLAIRAAPGWRRSCCSGVARRECRSRSCNVQTIRGLYKEMHLDYPVGRAREPAALRKGTRPRTRRPVDRLRTACRALSGAGMQGGDRPRTRLMCRGDWYRVPKLQRDRVWRTWRSGREA